MMNEQDQEQLEKNLNALPTMCLVNHPTEAEIVAIYKGQSGYYSTCVEDVEIANKAMNITPEQVQAMLIGSMFGWHVKGAHPDSHKK